MNRWDDATDYADWQRYQREVAANAAAVERDLFAIHWIADRRRQPWLMAAAIAVGFLTGVAAAVGASRLVGLGG